MEVSTHSNRGPFGCFSDHQGVSYEEDPFFEQEYGKQFGCSPSSSAARVVNPFVGGSVDVDEEGMSYEGGSSSCSSVGDCMAVDWEEELSSSGDESQVGQQRVWDDASSDSQGGVTVLSASTEMLRIRFPFLSISVRLADFLCLQEKDLLNDTIVDFYLNHIVEHVLPDEPNKRVTVLPAIFWHNLSILQSSRPDEFETMTSSEQQDARFADVLEFLEDFELFDVDYLVIPVNEWEHWSLAVVCHPFTDRGRTVFFDSQLRDDPNDLTTSATVIGEFLEYAWNKRSGVSGPMPELRCVVPMGMPQQENTYDCGLYVLEYAKKFLMNPPSDLDAINFSMLYPEFTVIGKRREIQKTILSLTANRNVWTPLFEMLEARSAQRNVERSTVTTHPLRC